VKLDKTGNLPSSPGYQNLVHDSAILPAPLFISGGPQAQGGRSDNNSMRFWGFQGHEQCQFDGSMPRAKTVLAAMITLHMRCSLETAKCLLER
jgi:hypothetical protein